MPIVLKEIYPTANKEHICEFCSGKIQPGEKYVRQTNIYYGLVYDFITHQECKDVAHELRMYDDCDDGVSEDDFCEFIRMYVQDNHYNKETSTVQDGWDLSTHELVKKILDELKKEDGR